MTSPTAKHQRNGSVTSSMNTAATRRSALLNELNTLAGIERSHPPYATAATNRSIHSAAGDQLSPLADTTNHQHHQQFNGKHQAAQQSSFSPTTTTAAPLPSIPRIDALSTVKSPASTKFGTGSRFAPSSSAFGSSTSSSGGGGITELLGTASPGFKYNPNYSAVQERSKGVVEWKVPRIEQLMRAAVEQQLAEEQQLNGRQKHGQSSRRGRLQLEREKQMLALLHGSHDSASVGQYNVKIDCIKPSIPKPVIGTSPRFDTTAASNLAPTTVNAGQNTSPGYHLVEPSPPSWSFGPPLRGNRTVNDTPSQPRTSFLTHSVDGGLARPATLENGIGPADYNNQIDTIATRSFAVAKSAAGSKQNMGCAPRFAPHQNATSFNTGPKYNVQLHNLSYRSKDARSMSLQWVP